MTSVPDPRTDPSVHPGKSGSSSLRPGEGLGIRPVLLVRLSHQALFIYVIIFVKTVLSVVASLPWPWVQSVFQACLHLTWLFQGLCPSFQPWLSGPASRGCDSAAYPKHLFQEARGVEAAQQGSEPTTLRKGTLHDTPCPLSARLKILGSQTCNPFMCQTAPGLVTQPLSRARAPSPKPCSVCLSSVPSVQ